MIKFIRKLGRIIPIEDKNQVGHAIAETVGLGLLAYPSLKVLAKKEMTERKKAFYELSGLGILTAATFKNSLPALIRIAKNVIK